MVDKYPEISAYNYCHWNPIKLFDPDGCEDDGYEYNIATAELSWISDEGRSEGMDYVHVISNLNTCVGIFPTSNATACKYQSSTFTSSSFGYESASITDGDNLFMYSHSIIVSNPTYFSTGGFGGLVQPFDYVGSGRLNVPSGFQDLQIGNASLGIGLGTTIFGEAANSALKETQGLKEIEGLNFLKEFHQFRDGRVL